MRVWQVRAKDSERDWLVKEFLTFDGQDKAARLRKALVKQAAEKHPELVFYVDFFQA